MSVRSEFSPGLGAMAKLPEVHSLRLLCEAPQLDFIVFDLQHGAFAPQDVSHLLPMLQVAGKQVWCRVHPSQTGLVTWLSDLGVNAVLLPTIEQASEVTDVVQSLRYPPAGRRSVAGARLGAGPDSVETLVIPMIETQKGVAALPDIVTLDGVAGVFVGPADLALDMAHPGAESIVGGDDAPQDYLDALQGIPLVAHAAHVRVGVHANTPLAIRKYASFKYDVFSVAVDVGVIREAYRAHLSQFDGVVNDE